MRPHDFEVGGIRLGYHEPVVVETVDFGDLDFRTQDVVHPRDDRILFGRDYLTPPVWVLSLATNPATFVGGLDSLAEVEGVWANSARKSPGWYTWLKYERAGEVRRVPGRPRKFSRSHSKTFRHGVVKATAEFQRLDTKVYGDESQSVRLTTVPGSVGGYTFPIVFPWGTKKTGGLRQGSVVVEGTTPTPATVVIHGPVKSPVVTGPGWRLSFPKLTLAYDQQITIDPRSQSVRRGDGASMVGFMDKFYFDELVMKPGTQEVTFSGVDDSGTGWARVSWYPAYQGM